MHDNISLKFKIYVYQETCRPYCRELQDKQQAVLLDTCNSCRLCCCSASDPPVCVLSRKSALARAACNRSGMLAITLSTCSTCWDVSVVLSNCFLFSSTGRDMAASAPSFCVMLTTFCMYACSVSLSLGRPCMQRSFLNCAKVFLIFSPGFCAQLRDDELALLGETLPLSPQSFPCGHSCFFRRSQSSFRGRRQTSFLCLASIFHTVRERCLRGLFVPKCLGKRQTCQHPLPCTCFRKPTDRIHVAVMLLDVPSR